MAAAEYVLAGEDEQRRLELQARVWEPTTEALLERIGVQPGFRCLDIGCGAMGILGPLSRRAGVGGRVVGVEPDAKLLGAARTYVENAGLGNVELVRGDVDSSEIANDAWDLVHERFVLPHVADPASFIRRMCVLARPSALVVLQEPDHGSWNYYPEIPAWKGLLGVIERTFALSGDINIGRRTFGLLRDLGLREVQVEAAVRALEPGHPYLRMPLVAIAAMRARAVAAGVASDTEIDDLVRGVEEGLADASTYMVTFTTVQVWGRRPT